MNNSAAQIILKSPNNCQDCPFSNLECPNFDPQLAIEGDPKSKLWIVGLNPNIREGECLDWKDWENKPRPPGWTNINYFSQLALAIGKDRIKRLGHPASNNGIAHTDIVKCGSPNFNFEEREAVKHCKNYLLEQIQAHCPRVIFCNGVRVSQFFQSLEGVQVSLNQTTAIWRGCEEGNGCKEEIYLIFSGFLSRLDNYSKLRIFQDVDAICKPLGL